MKALTRREFVKRAAATISVAGPGLRLLAGQKSTEHPNFIFVFPDQMRFSAMSCMKGIPGADLESQNLQTPNLDKLAAGGILFANAFSSTPVCSPYRTGIQTGKYSHTVGWKLLPSETSLPMDFKKAGYSTGDIGKWHMSTPAPRSSRKEKSKKGRGTIRQYVAPKNRKGWDFWPGHEVSHRYFGNGGMNGALYYLNDEEKPMLLKKGEYEPTVQTDMAIEYLKKKGDGPFLLCLSYGPPHNPYTPPKTHPPVTKSKIKKGQHSSTLMGSVNYMPTMLGFAGLPIPKGVQGRDLSQIILGEKPDDEDTLSLKQTQPGNTAHQAPWRAVRTKRYLYAEGGHLAESEWLLYDVKGDPYQQKNLIGTPEASAVKAKLKTKLADWRKRTGDTQNMQAVAREWGQRARSRKR